MGIQLKLTRIKKGIQQKELAAKVGISSQYLMMMEQGKAKNPSVEVMKRIAEALDASVGELFFDEK